MKELHCLNSETNPNKLHNIRLQVFLSFDFDVLCDILINFIMEELPDTISELKCSQNVGIKKSYVTSTRKPIFI